MTSMSGYTKLFNSILASTVWREPMEVRIVWITLLAMADKDGIAEGSVPGLADFARIPVEATRKALERLSSPDPDSRSQEHDGRRIQAVDGGWQLLNHAKYRAKMGADERREYNRLKQAQYRAGLSPSITVNDNVRCVDNTEAKADTEAKALTTTIAGLNVFAWERFFEYRKEIGKPYKKASIQAAQKKLSGFGPMQGDVVEQTIANGWTGLFDLKGNGNGKDQRSRAKRFSDKLDEIARRDIEQNGHTDKLG